MDKYFKSPAQRPIPQSIENILGILSDVDDNICEEDSLICDEEDVFGNTNIEKLKKVTLTGTILFSPSILAEENMFNITLLGDDRPYILKLNRKMHNRSTTVLKSGERYLFQCEKEQEQEQEQEKTETVSSTSASNSGSTSSFVSGTPEITYRIENLEYQMEEYEEKADDAFDDGLQLVVCAVVSLGAAILGCKATSDLNKCHKMYLLELEKELGESA